MLNEPNQKHSENLDDMTATQRESFEKPLKRFTRNRNLPGELEEFRYKLIQARVLNGFSTDEATKRFATAHLEHIPVELIESGAQKTPNDWRFLKQAAEVYAVSVDWLLGLSPNAERDSKVAHQYALLRGTESAVHEVLGLFVDAAAKTARETQLHSDEVAHIVGAASNFVERFKKFSAGEAFQDLPGGAPVVAAVERLAASLDPLMRVHGQFRELEKIFDEVKEGRLKPIPYLAERFDSCAG